MKCRRVGLGMTVIVSGCGSLSTIQASETTARRIPTLEEMRRILPGSLTPEEAKRVLVKVPGDKVLVPVATSNVIEPSRSGRGGRGSARGGRGGHAWGGRGGRGGNGWHRRSWGRGGAFFGGGVDFYPFSYLGTDLFAPYALEGGLYSPYAFSPYAAGDPYLAAPFLGAGCGSYLPYMPGPAWVGAAYGTFGCGGGFPVLPAGL